jgi:hypothetical protein
MLTRLDTSRDKREHFGCMCLDMDAIGMRKYPYAAWAQALIKMYLVDGLTADDTGKFTSWEQIPGLLTDTSHANRTAYFAVKAFTLGLVPAAVISGLCATLKNIHKPEKAKFYFSNQTDGADVATGTLAAGRIGNVWFGWNHLARYDAELADLFCALADDLSTGGANIQPVQAQNRTFPEAAPCFYAGAVRLI